MSVLVRAGEAPLAFDVAEATGEEDYEQWVTLGAMCAFNRQLDIVKSQIGEMDNNEAIAALCLGAAFGKFEMNECDGETPQLATKRREKGDREKGHV